MAAVTNAPKLHAFGLRVQGHYIDVIKFTIETDALVYQDHQTFEHSNGITQSHEIVAVHAQSSGMVAAYILVN